MSLIAISGKIGSGKDLIGEIIQQLFWWKNTEANVLGYDYSSFLLLRETGQYKHNLQHYSKSEIKRFADSLKDIVCILLGCSREQLEAREFKEKELGEEWKKYRIITKGLNNYYVNSIEEAQRICHPNKNVKRYVEVKLTPRLLLQLLGTECGREILHPNIWVNALMSKYKASIVKTEYSAIYNEKNLPNWIITDLRFPNELKAVKDRGGISIRVNRPKNDLENHKDCIKSKDGYCIKEEYNYCKGSCEFEHPSETALDNAAFDYTIQNDGTIEDLIHTIKLILIKEKLI